MVWHHHVMTGVVGKVETGHPAKKKRSFNSPGGSLWRRPQQPSLPHLSQHHR
jgi:hypothetical protein